MLNGKIISGLKVQSCKLENVTVKSLTYENVVLFIPHFKTAIAPYKVAYKV